MARQPLSARKRSPGWHATPVINALVCSPTAGTRPRSTTVYPMFCRKGGLSPDNRPLDARSAPRRRWSTLKWDMRPDSVATGQRVYQRLVGKLTRSTRDRGAGCAAYELDDGSLRQRGPGAYGREERNSRPCGAT